MSDYLFQTGKDLSENHEFFARRKKGTTTDIYVFLKCPSIEIKHSGKYTAATLINEDPERGNTYLPGDPIDCFDVWEQQEWADPSTGKPSRYSKESANHPTFAAAVLAVYAIWFKHLVRFSPVPDLFNHAKLG